MKITTTLIVMYLAGLISAYGSPQALNVLLDERITANEELTKRILSDAEESKFKDKLVPLEKKLGANWIEYLKYIRSSKDDKLKAMTLRLEYLQDLAAAYYDLEYEELKSKQAVFKKKIDNSKKQLKQLEKLIEQDGAEKPAAVPSR